MTKKGFEMWDEKTVKMDISPKSKYEVGYKVVDGRILHDIKLKIEVKKQKMKEEIIEVVEVTIQNKPYFKVISYQSEFINAISGSEVLDDFQIRRLKSSGFKVHVSSYE